MSRKLSPWDMLRFAEEGDDGDDPDGDNTGGGGGDNNESEDLKALRSEKDKEIAELRNAIKDLQSQGQQSSTQAAANDAYNRALGQVSGLIKEIEESDDPEKAKEKALQHLGLVGEWYANAAGRGAQFQTHWKETRAENLALQIQVAGGGDVDTYRARLLKANTVAEMDAIADTLRAETGGNRRRRTQDNNNGNGNSGGNNRQRPRPDGGRGTGTGTDLLSEMLDIDTSTPEGRAKWEEKRSGFRQRISAGTR